MQIFGKFSKIRLYIPAPLRASFLASTKEMLKLEANKIKELWASRKFNLINHYEYGNQIQQRQDCDY